MSLISLFFGDLAARISSSEFLLGAVGPEHPAAFTRQRKLPLPALVALMLCGMRMSIQCDLDEFFAHLDNQVINFDDRRTAAGLKVLGDRSRKMHVIFLTHHDHLVPLAKEVLGAYLDVVYLNSVLSAGRSDSALIFARTTDFPAYFVADHIPA